MTLMARRQALLRRHLRAVVGVAVVLSGTLFLVVSLSTGGASAGFYLVIGASDARGFEPSGTMTPRGPAEAATNNGYANDLASMLSAKGSSVTLDNIACPGETIQSFVGGGDACTPSTSQLRRAETFLREHAADSGIVTIDVGFNDMRPCLQFARVDEKCVASSVALVKEDLPAALVGLERAGGPQVTFVGITYGDPFLAHYLTPSLGPSNAAATLGAMERLDAALDAVFTAAHMDVAPVESALRVDDTAVTARYDGRPVPVNVAEACKTTWMCRAAPWGPNDHPNNEGYSLIARAIAQVLPPPFS
ncbi:MAG TPA: SGNH/GDSL hydrolase family protein [Acidimicrobiales bacterium]|nr:SGNH/GDSL hydrolase family protein [Acidimicrobiales bacterium]